MLTLLLVATWWMRGQAGFGGEWQSYSGNVTACGQGSAFACAVDGDTIRMGNRRIRLTGFDAPELDGACEAEMELARDARLALANWLNDAPFEMDGGDDPPFDRYGRELRKVRRRAEGSRVEWLEDTMARRGLAQRDGQGGKDWCR